MKKIEHVVKKVEKDSIAWEMEIEPGDVLLKINDEEIEDIFDYQYLIQDEYIEVLIKKQDGEEWLLEIDKDELAMLRKKKDENKRNKLSDQLFNNILKNIVPIRKDRHNPRNDNKKNKHPINKRKSI